MGEGRDALGTAVADFASHAHQVAGHGDAGGMRSSATTVIKSIGAELSAHPYGVVRAADAGQNRRLRNQRRPNG